MAIMDSGGTGYSRNYGSDDEEEETKWEKLNMSKSRYDSMVSGSDDSDDDEDDHSEYDDDPRRASDTRYVPDEQEPDPVLDPSQTGDNPPSSRDEPPDDINDRQSTPNYTNQHPGDSQDEGDGINERQSTPNYTNRHPGENQEEQEAPVTGDDDEFNDPDTPLERNQPGNVEDRNTVDEEHQSDNRPEDSILEGGGVTGDEDTNVVDETRETVRNIEMPDLPELPDPPTPTIGVPWYLKVGGVLAVISVVSYMVGQLFNINVGEGG